MTKVELIVICIGIYLSFSNTEGQNKKKKLKATLGSWELRRLSNRLETFNRISTCLRMSPLPIDQKAIKGINNL